MTGNDNVLVHVLAVLNDQVEDMAAILQKHHKLEEFSHLGLPAQV